MSRPMPHASKRTLSLITGKTDVEAGSASRDGSPTVYRLPPSWRGKLETVFTWRTVCNLSTWSVSAGRWGDSGSIEWKAKRGFIAKVNKDVFGVFQTLTEAMAALEAEIRRRDAADDAAKHKGATQ